MPSPESESRRGHFDGPSGCPNCAALQDQLADERAHTRDLVGRLHARDRVSRRRELLANTWDQRAHGSPFLEPQEIAARMARHAIPSRPGQAITWQQFLLWICEPHELCKIAAGCHGIRACEKPCPVSASCSGWEAVDTQRVRRPPMTGSEVEALALAGLTLLPFRDLARNERTNRAK